ncbi:hypothetical protein [Paraburkholderia tropica]|uniref:hypothetical protein n=1 Tax=Paraburkholderia tropica TaxID=92647 RepID=UPI002AB1955A|nr:hypothetical protein [Paraburkholderia tropica]
MTYGFKVIGDSGSIQIDDTYANLAVIGSGTVSLSNGWGSNNMAWYGDVSVDVGDSTSYPLIGWNGGNGSSYVVCLGHTISGTVHTWRLLTINSNGTLSGEGPMVINWYVFGRPTVSSNGYGLRVRDANGRVTFDSGNHYMTVIGAINTTWNALANAGAVSTSPLRTAYSSNVVIVLGDCGINNYVMFLAPASYFWATQFAACRIVGGSNVDSACQLQAEQTAIGSTSPTLPGIRQVLSNIIASADVL